MEKADLIVRSVLNHYPQTQAIYFFGSFGTSDERGDSDVDIAILLAHDKAKDVGDLSMSDLRFELESLLNKEVDLINLSQVSTVFQKEVIMTDRRIFQSDENAADQFEMLTISYYQKLNEERKELLEEIEKNGRILQL